jgi:hypothetical protein
MRYIMLMKSSAANDAGEMASMDLIEAMGKYNDQMTKAGVLLEAEGLHGSDKGARVFLGGAKPKVVEGPFENPDDLVAGYWMLQVKSKEEAIEWARRCPAIHGKGSQVELRRVFEASDFEQATGIETAPSAN